MSDKKLLIIEKASELFAKNGFDATSVQEITDACGISKGSFYLSFKSKESLLISIFEYFGTKLTDRINGVFEMRITPRQRFEQFFIIQCEEIANYSDFILMQIRERTNPMNEEMMSIMNDVHRRTYEIQENLLLDIFGNGIRRHMPDLSLILNGIMKGYIEIIIFNKDALNYEKLASFILERVDSIINGLSEPFLKKEQLIGFNKLWCVKSITVEELLKDITRIKKELTDEDLTISLEVIEQELSSTDYRKPVILGMMTNLERDASLEELLNKLKLLLDRV